MHCLNSAIMQYCFMQTQQFCSESVGIVRNYLLIIWVALKISECTSETQRCMRKCHCVMGSYTSRAKANHVSFDGTKTISAHVNIKRWQGVKLDQWEHSITRCRCDMLQWKWSQTQIVKSHPQCAVHVFFEMVTLSIRKTVSYCYTLNAERRLHVRS